MTGSKEKERKVKVSTLKTFSLVEELYHTSKQWCHLLKLLRGCSAGATPGSSSCLRLLNPRHHTHTHTRSGAAASKAVRTLNIFKTWAVKSEKRKRRRRSWAEINVRIRNSTFNDFNGLHVWLRCWKCVISVEIDLRRTRPENANWS